MKRLVDEKTIAKRLLDLRLQVRFQQSRFSVFVLMSNRVKSSQALMVHNQGTPAATRSVTRTNVVSERPKAAPESSCLFINSSHNCETSLGISSSATTGSDVSVVFSSWSFACHVNSPPSVMTLEVGLLVTVFSCPLGGWALGLWQGAQITGGAIVN